MSDKIAVENINTPGRTNNVDKAKYTAKEAKDAALAHLPQDLFPGGATSGWWLKCVQLDLEAKGMVIRENTKPLRFHQT